LTASGSPRRADTRVADLSHGERRQLEIAMALATKPPLLLLDEPMAGMGPDESARMVETLRALKGGITILLIEHDMEAVFALADRITVLVYGRIIASGTPAAIRADAAVRQAYLGERKRMRGRGLRRRCSKYPASRPATGSAACCSAFRSRSRPAKWSR
jgi:branched-chain amino acid transport system ATP-binding protein